MTELCQSFFFRFLNRVFSAVDSRSMISGSCLSSTSLPILEMPRQSAHGRARS